MIPLKSALSSSVGRKYLMAISGLSLVGFVIMHLIGNLTLLIPGGEAFNAYASKLESLGPVLYVMEIGLVLFFLIHIKMAIQVKLKNNSARPEKYAHASVSKGGNSKSNISSRNMIVTGIVLLVFLILHIRFFKFGPGIAEGYKIELAGHEVRDLYRLVHESFQSTGLVAFYVFVMLLLGLHLRHGFWSAFQSLGLQNPRFSKPIYALGILLAVALSIGFLILPIYLHMNA